MRDGLRQPLISQQGGLRPKLFPCADGHGQRIGGSLRAKSMSGALRPPSLCMNANNALVAILIFASGCAHHAAIQVAAPPAWTSPHQLCMRPSGFCTETFHGFRCALLPSDTREVWSGRWHAMAVAPSDYQTQEVRNLIRSGWWYTCPSYTPDGRITDSVTLMKPTD